MLDNCTGNGDTHCDGRHILDTDMSDELLGAVLQEQGSDLKVIAYAR